MMRDDVRKAGAQIRHSSVGVVASGGYGRRKFDSFNFARSSCSVVKSDCSVPPVTLSDRSDCSVGR